MSSSFTRNYSSNCITEEFNNAVEKANTERRTLGILGYLRGVSAVRGTKNKSKRPTAIRFDDSGRGSRRGGNQER